MRSNEFATNRTYFRPFLSERSFNPLNARLFVTNVSTDALWFFENICKTIFCSIKKKKPPEETGNNAPRDQIYIWNQANLR